VPPEDAVVRRLDRFRREAELDEGPDTTREERIVEAVDAAPVVDRPAIDELHRAENVMEDRVESQVTKAELVGGGFELGLRFRALQRAGII